MKNAAGITIGEAWNVIIFISTHERNNSDARKDRLNYFDVPSKRYRDSVSIIIIKAAGSRNIKLLYSPASDDNMFTIQAYTVIVILLL